MKRRMIFIGLIVMVTADKISAQTTDSVSNPVKTGSEWRMPDDVINRAKAFSDHLKIELNLDAETTHKLFQAYLANTKPMGEIKMMPITDKEKTVRLKANQSAFNDTIKGILAPEKYSNYLKMSSKKE